MGQFIQFFSKNKRSNFSARLFLETFGINFEVAGRKIEGFADVGFRDWFKCVFGCFSEDWRVLSDLDKKGKPF